MGKRVKAGDKSLAVAYIRVSTDKERQALGAEAQRHAIAQWADKNGVRIASWFEEEISGGAKLHERTVLLEALAAVQANGAGHLIVQRLDRFSRDPMSAGLAEAELVRFGAQLSIAVGGGDGDDPAAEMLRTVMLAAAKFEKRMIAARIRAALAVKKRRGERMGECTFGFTAGPDKLLVPHPGEQAIIARVRELADAGLTQRAIASRLAEEGIASLRSGKPFSQTQVGRILRAA